MIKKTLTVPVATNRALHSIVHANGASNNLLQILLITLLDQQHQP